MKKPRLNMRKRERKDNLIAGRDGGVVGGRRDAVGGVTHDEVGAEVSLTRINFHGSIFE